ncbi:CinA family protein [Roseomonas sp. OT10]|uniref:CinA family protein n=1 Tax=Roseomonas cutis TaxID=2897332 RepID=UPI001E507D00|nr:CinA family protein [Roseomonas sp. OT10]UFN47085.1 CinA family protein [Roseomonas sp. OT10]
MRDLMPAAARLSALLTAQRATVAVAESSAGGLVSAALLSVPGASAYFLGGAVVYTGQARAALLGITPGDMAGMRPSTEAYALLLARRVRERFGAVWGLAETGAAGPTGNRYGDPAGHACLAVSDGTVERVMTVSTGESNRAENMRGFASALLDLLAGTLGQP